MKVIQMTRIYYIFLIRCIYIFIFVGYYSCLLDAQVITKKNAQQSDLKLLAKADKCFKAKKYFKALKFYDKALLKQPKFIDALIKKGSTYAELEDWKNALQSYQKALELDPNFSSRLHFTAAMIAYRQEDFSTAMVHFENYTHSPKTTKARLESAKKYLEKSKFCLEAMHNPVPFDPIKLPSPINTRYSEFLPTLTAEQVMVFSRNTNNQEDLYYSIKVNNIWGEPVPLSNINTPENEAAHSISADGEWLVFTVCNRKESLGSCDLFISKRKGDVWSSPKNIGEPINSTGWEAQPSLSANGNEIIFASNRIGGHGDYDLWSSRKVNGKWTTPINLGNQINGPGKDETPYLHPDGKTLYFSSNGHLGMGDSDLFISRKENGKWGVPKNLGYPINTKDKEGALSVGIDGKQAYYASDRDKDNEVPNLDIFTFELPENFRATPVTFVKSKLIDAVSKVPIQGRVSIVDLSNNKETAILEISNKEEILVCLPTGNDYAFHATSSGYSLASKHFDLSEYRDKYDPYDLSIELYKIESIKDDDSKPIVLKNIFFKTGSADLLEESYIELNYLKNYLIENGQIKIDISGHTDNTGSNDINNTLSHNRAKAVYTFLIKEGIREDRLSFKGYGDSKPVDTNTTESGRMNNRRTEFTIRNG